MATYLHTCQDNLNDHPIINGVFLPEGCQSIVIVVFKEQYFLKEITIRMLWELEARKRGREGEREGCVY